MKSWIKAPKMTDVAAKVIDSSSDNEGNRIITVHWWNTGRCMGLPPFPMYRTATRPVTEVIKVKEEILSDWLQADNIEDLV